MLQVKRRDPAFRGIDRGLTTIAWDADAAHLKTHGSIEVDGQTYTLTSVADNAATERAKADMASGTFEPSSFLEGRVEAAKEAARLLGVETPTESMITSAARIENDRMWELMPSANPAPGSYTGEVDPEIEARFAALGPDEM
jgi:hypothetical protein